MRAFLSLLALATLVLSAPRCAVAQPGPGTASPAAQPARADSLFATGEWRQAAAAYAAWLKRNPADARAWSRLGAARHALGEFREAARAWERADAITPSPAGRYNLACAWARQGDAAKALEWLRGAVDAGFAQGAALDTDPDLESLRGLPAFSDLAAEVRRRSRPCERWDEARQLDFWVGEWEVFTPQGSRAGSSVIARAVADCAILEHWQGAFGDSGMSMNAYDGTQGRWRQLWMGQRGRIAEFTGGIRDGSMVFEGFRQGLDGVRVPARMTLTPLPGGEVRQLGEDSKDGGTTWTTLYEFIYRPRR